ncbi:hypothetical protein cypCar_00028285, partial [Cyprinus carpio]
MLRRGTCAFSILFKLFSEGLYSAKLFLTATLHEPIMQLLVEDEDHLETDPAKLIERFTPAQQERLFGEKGTDEYRRKVQAAVEANEAKLVALVNTFIGYLRQNTYCFPQSLRWIMSQMYKTLAHVERLEVGEVRTMCTDLLLTCFICPAIVNPEQYGIISDAPINEVARFNLMQVGQLLQQLAMSDADDGDPRRKSSLSKFDKVDFVRSVTAGDQLREEDHLALETLLANVPQSRTTKSNSLELTPSNTPQLSPATTPANKKNRLPIAGSRSRSRSNVAQEGEIEASSQESLQEVTPEDVLVISLGTSLQTVPGMMSENEVLTLHLGDGGQGDAPVDDTKLHGKPDKTLRFSLCSDNLEGISEGPSNRSNSVSSLDLEVESVSEGGPGPSGSNGAEALQLLEHEQATTQDNLDDKLRKFEIRDMMGLTDDRDISETVSETWSTDVLGSDFDPNMDEDRLQEMAGAAAENALGSLLCLPVLLDPYGSTISETTSEAWSVEVLPSDSEAADLKQEERLQELESCSGVGSTSDDTEVREVSSRPSTPGLSVVSVGGFADLLHIVCAGISATSEDIPNKIEDLRSECSSDFGGKDSVTSPDGEDSAHGAHGLSCAPSQADSLLAMFDPLSSGEGSSTGTIVRPKVHYPRPLHPPPDPPIPEACITGHQEPRPPLFAPHLAQSDLEHPKQRHSYPERLVRSRSTDVVSAGRRPNSDPGLNRRTVMEEREPAGAYSTGPTSSPSKDSLKGESEDRKDSDDEKSDRNRPWWKKRFVPAIPKVPIGGLRKRDKLEKDEQGAERVQQGIPDEPSAFRQSSKTQSAEAIMDKYKYIMERRPTHSDGAVAGSYVGQEPCREGDSEHDSPKDEALQNISADDLPDSASQTAPPQDKTFSFSDIKKKLRLALCSADSVVFPIIPPATTRNGLPDHADHEAFQCCTAADDKTAAVEDFLRYLYGAMAHDAIWQYASEEQLQDAQMAIERSVMNRIFKLAFYPNQDGDIHRDELFHEHIQRLSKVVTANHKALQIPEVTICTMSQNIVYLKEAPWPSAQAEIRTINAYKTPRDKVQCILRMCSTIMNLLSLANEDAVPGADDFVPVLVFVLIK